LVPGIDSSVISQSN